MSRILSQSRGVANHHRVIPSSYSLNSVDLNNAFEGG